MKKKLVVLLLAAILIVAFVDSQPRKAKVLP